MSCVKYLKVSYCFFLKFQRSVLGTSSKRPEKMSVGWRPWHVPRTSILNLSYKCIFNALISILFQQMCAWNNNCFIVLGFWRNVLKTSYKGPKVTSGVWRSWDVPRTSMLNINAKHISVVIFSGLVHQSVYYILKS